MTATVPDVTCQYLLEGEEGQGFLFLGLLLKKEENFTKSSPSVLAPMSQPELDDVPLSKPFLVKRKESL